MKRQFKTFLLVALIGIFMVGCGSSGVNTPAKVNNISGTASMGPINGGNVSVYALKADGSKGNLLGSAKTGIDGSYSVDIGSYTGNVLVEVTGGSYTDEATGMSVLNTVAIRAALANVSDSVSIAVTPLTEIAVQTAGGVLTSDNITVANALLSALVGVDIVGTMPSDVTKDPLTSTVDQITYGLMLASISQMTDFTYGGDASAAITAIKDDLTDNKLDTTGNNLLSALNTFYTNSNNKTGVSNAELTKLDETISYIASNEITIDSQTVTDLDKAKRLIADLRNTALSIYNYEGIGALGVVETPFKNLAEEFETKITPELTDTIDRIGWIIESADGIEPGNAMTVTDGSYTLNITKSADDTELSFTVKDGTKNTIDSGSITINDPDNPTTGTFNATMKTVSGELVASMNYKGTVSGNIYTSMEFTGSMIAPGFSLDFSKDSRKLYATFEKIPITSPEFPDDIYPTRILLDGRVTTSTAQMDGKLDVSAIWANKADAYSDWEWVNGQWQEITVCEGDMRPSNATFTGSFQELQNGIATGTKFVGTLTGKWDNAITFDGCAETDIVNFPRWSATFNGKIEAPSRPSIDVLLKIAQNKSDTFGLDVSYTRTETDGTKVFLSGNGTIIEKEITVEECWYGYNGDKYCWDETHTESVLTATLTNQDSMKLEISNDSSKSKDKEFTGNISTSGGDWMADLYTEESVPMVKYKDGYIESIF